LELFLHYNGLHMQLKTIIAKLEKQQRELSDIIAALTLIEHSGVQTPNREISLRDFEKQLIAQALARAGGNQTKAAHILQVSRDTVRYKMAKHGLKRE